MMNVLTPNVFICCDCWVGFRIQDHPEASKIPPKYPASHKHRLQEKDVCDRCYKIALKTLHTQEQMRKWLEKNREFAHG